LVSIRTSRESDAPKLFRIWARAVDVTHDFLSAEDRTAIEPDVMDYVSTTPLVLAVDGNDEPVAFMGLSGANMDSLFIDPDWHGQGVGRMLVGYAFHGRDVLTTDVNEQNEQAVRFYRRLGFEPTGREPTDTEGRPYPLLYMRLERENWIGSRGEQPSLGGGTVCPK